MVDTHQHPGKRRGGVGKQWHAANTHRGVGHGNPRVRAADTPTTVAARTAEAPHRHTSLRDVVVGPRHCATRPSIAHHTVAGNPHTADSTGATTARSTETNTNALQVHKTTPTRPRGGRGSGNTAAQSAQSTQCAHTQPASGGLHTQDHDACQHRDRDIVNYHV